MLDLNATFFISVSNIKAISASTSDFKVALCYNYAIFFVLQSQLMLYLNRTYK